jgi:hypothetical protein
MRRAVLLGALGAVLLSTAAYAATFTNTYILFTHFSPIKSGTKSKPNPIGTNLQFNVGTNPSGFRPNVVSNYKVFISGITENTNQFPVCASSRLLAPKQGPKSCQRGSMVGAGHLIALTGPSSNSSAIYNFPKQCSLQVQIFNQGQHRLVLYIFAGSAVSGRAACSLSKPVAVALSLTPSKTGLGGTFTLPTILRHPTSGQDQAVVTGVLAIPVAKRKIGKRTYGLLESVACPSNHQRATTMTFTEETGGSRSATRNFFCK